MSDLDNFSTEDLEREVERRRGPEPCSCGKWQSYLGAYDADGYTRRCHGCLRAVGKCRCR